MLVRFSPQFPVFDPCACVLANRIASASDAFVLPFACNQEISEFYLSAFLAQLQSDGYSIFTVQGALPVPMRDTSLGDDLACWHPLAACLTAAQPRPAKTHKVDGNSDACMA